MKKVLLLFTVIVFSNISLLAQPCLPEGITFTTQEEIDNFPTNYPLCTEIEGDVIISGEDITNMEGLFVLTSLGGGLNIDENVGLTSLTGLDNVISIGGKLHIYSNDSLSSLTGMENVTFYGGDIYIGSNHALTSLTGLLENMTSIEGALSIGFNSALTSLTGMENVTSIGGNLFIASNNALTSLTGLGNVTSIGGELYIASNNALTSLSGLENVTSIGGNLYIGYTNTLTSLSGLDNVISIGGDLGISYNSVLTSLTALSNVTYIGKHLFITYNDSLTSLTGLGNVTSIGGSLSFGHNSTLNSLTGLENISSIPGSLDIYYMDSLSSLTGLENVTSIGNGLYIDSNNGLTSLTGLENVTSIEGYIWIISNNVLTSLSGMENIYPGSIADLWISDNTSLTNCAVQSICNYITNPYGSITLSNNAPGCNDLTEVETACPISTISLLDLKVFLEGDFEGTGMRTDLNSIIPLSQPFNQPPWNYTGSESVSTIPNSDIVDWILIELRETSGDAVTATELTTIYKKAVFLKKDGSIVDLNGFALPLFDIPISENLYLVVWHRNHLAVMSATPLIETGGIYNYDFTDDITKAFNDGQIEISPGTYGMIGGDSDGNGIIENEDVDNNWSATSGNKGYDKSDLNLDTEINNIDKDDYWFINLGIEAQLPLEVPFSCGDQISDIDGNTYNTVQIGDQCWMKENLNIGTRLYVDEQSNDNGIIEKYCYDDDTTNCNTYGGLYQWNEMMDYSTVEGTQGICPIGWHIPTDIEWTTIVNFLGGESVAGIKMKSTGTIEDETGLWYEWFVGIGGTNESEFTAHPGGTHAMDNFYGLIGSRAYFWSSTEESTEIAWFLYLKSSSDMAFHGFENKEYGFSVRCLKD